MWYNIAPIYHLRRGNFTSRFSSFLSRYHKCLSCYEKLSAIRAILLKKQSTPGKLGASFRELAVLIRSLEWPRKQRRPSWIRPPVSSSVDDSVSSRWSAQWRNEGHVVAVKWKRNKFYRGVATISWSLRKHVKFLVAAAAAAFFHHPRSIRLPIAFPLLSPQSRTDSQRKRTKLWDIRYLVIERSKESSLMGKKNKEKEGVLVKARKERNLDEEKFAKLNERRVKARKNILSPNISNIVLKHQD